ncbi:MAG: hypothetical protein ACE5G1_05895 [bacterium]
MRFLIKVLAGLGVLVIWGASAFAQGKFKGYMFGDYYYALKNHNSSNEDSNGFGSDGSILPTITPSTKSFQSAFDWS